MPLRFCLFFFFNDTATTEIYTLSLHDALPIFRPAGLPPPARDLDGDLSLRPRGACVGDRRLDPRPARAKRKDRKSTRLNSSHGYISYAVFCLKKKKTMNRIDLAISRTSRRTWS